MKNKFFKIMKEQLSVSLGFGTEKEKIDAELITYRRKDIDEINYQIKKTTAVLNELNSEIYYFEKILKSNKKIYDLCQSILEQAEEEILKPTSEIKVPLYNSDNTILAFSNIATLREIIKYKKIPNSIFYIQQLENKINLIIYDFLSNVINNKGYYNVNDKKIDFREIYNQYLQILSFMNIGALLDSQGNSIIINGEGKELILKLKEFCSNNIYTLNPILQKLYFSKKELEEQNKKNEYSLETIENAKKLILASKEYIQAKGRHDFIEAAKKK